MQNGFRRGKSCAKNLVKLFADATRSNIVGEFTLSAFLDVSSAYDNVNLDIFLNKLKLKKCPKRILNFLVSWTMPRYTQFIVSYQTIVEKMISRGLPQEAILSPILYTFYTKDITSGLARNISLVQLANDIAIYRSDKFRFNNRILLEAAVDRIRNLEKLGLLLEPSKCNLIEFTKSRYYDRNTHINIKGKKEKNNF